MKTNYSQGTWTEGIAFYLDGTGFTFKRNLLHQARAPLSSTEATLCCGEAWKKEKESAQGTIIAVYRDTQREPLRRREGSCTKSSCPEKEIWGFGSGMHRKGPQRGDWRQSITTDGGSFLQ